GDRARSRPEDHPARRLLRERRRHHPRKERRAHHPRAPGDVRGRRQESDRRDPRPDSEGGAEEGGDQDGDLGWIERGSFVGAEEGRQGDREAAERNLVAHRSWFVVRRRTTNDQPRTMVTLKDVFRQLIRDVRSEKLRTFLTVFGIVWGTVAISLMLAFGTGLHKQLVKNTAGLGDR